MPRVKMADKPAPLRQSGTTVSETMLSFVNHLRISVTLHCFRVQHIRFKYKNAFGKDICCTLFFIPTWVPVRFVGGHKDPNWILRANIVWVPEWLSDRFSDWTTELVNELVTKWPLDNWEPKKMQMEMCWKGHKTQKKCVKISSIWLKEVIFTVLRSKSRFLRRLWKILRRRASFFLPLLETLHWLSDN